MYNTVYYLQNSDISLFFVISSGNGVSAPEIAVHAVEAKAKEV